MSLKHNSEMITPTVVIASYMTVLLKTGATLTTYTIWVCTDVGVNSIYSHAE